MNYSLFTVLDKIEGMASLLRNYRSQNGLSDHVDAILRAYGELVWDDADISFTIEFTQNPREHDRRVCKLKKDWDEDWDVSTCHVIYGLRKSDYTFVVYLYSPKQDYIDRLDTMVEYLPDGAVIDCEVKDNKGNLKGNPDQDSEDYPF